MDMAGILEECRNWRRWLLVGMILWALAATLAPTPPPANDATTPALAGPIDGGNG